MKIRIFLITLLLFTGYCLKAQPPETIYEGTVIASGFKRNILANDGPFPIGFNFTFFGNIYTQFYVSANGLVMFGDPADLFDTEADIPTVAAPNNYIAPFWDNLSIMDGGNIMYKTIGGSPSRKCIIQFKNMGFDPIPNPFGTFSVILYENSNVIQMQYRLITDPYTPQSHGESATIGLENATGSAGVKYAYHVENAIHSEHVTSFTPSGSTYTVNEDATYEGVFLTTNATLPDPGITDLAIPSEDAVVGSSQTFEWSAATNTTTYYLVIDTFPTLATATYYDAGTSLSYNVSGLKINKTWYYGVFASNATALTWCEVRRFSTADNPPLTAVPATLWVVQGSETMKKLQYSGGDAGAKTAIITSLPAQGTLWQVSGGVKGTQITSTQTTVTDAAFNIIYAATGGTGNGVGNFRFKFSDGTGESPEATIKVNVSPTVLPNLLYTAKTTTYIEMQYDRAMSDPSGRQGQFIATVNGLPGTIASLALKTGDPYTIIATLTSPISLSDAVTISYTAGDISSAQGGLLATFNAQTVTLQAQTITFTTNLSKKYNDPPFALSAAASSGLSITYSSSNLTVATIAGATITLKAVGTSDITARQAGNGTWAPAQYLRPLTVAKGDQTITFGALSDKTYGDVDFSISATSSSGLNVSFASGNNSVATVAGNSVHIAGAGTTVITASQAGNSSWNAAPDVPQTINVNKADQTITFDILPEKTVGDPDFGLTATASSGLIVGYSSGDLLVATLTGNTVHLVAAGTTIITASQAGNNDYNPAPDIPQTLTVVDPVGLENPVTSQNSFHIFTTYSYLNIQTLADDWDGKTGSVNIIDLTGKPLRKLNNVEFSKNSLIQVNSPDRKGLYIIEIKSGVQRFTGKVVIR